MNNNQNNPQGVKMFKVLKGYGKDHLQNVPTVIPWAMLNEKQAISNHSQTLTQLNERGGMCVTELLNNIKNERLNLSGKTDQSHVDELNQLIANFLTPQEVPQVKSVEEEANLYAWEEFKKHSSPVGLSFSENGYIAGFNSAKLKMDRLERKIKHLEEYKQTERIRRSKFATTIARLEHKNSDLKSSIIILIERFKDRSWFKQDVFAITKAEQALNSNES